MNSVSLRPPPSAQRRTSPCHSLMQRLIFLLTFRHLYEISSFQLTSSAKLVLAYPNLNGIGPEAFPKWRGFLWLSLRESASLHSSADLIACGDRRILRSPQRLASLPRARRVHPRRRICAERGEQRPLPPQRRQGRLRGIRVVEAAPLQGHVGRMEVRPHLPAFRLVGVARALRGQVGRNIPRGRRPSCEAGASGVRPHGEAEPDWSGNKHFSLFPW